MVHHFNLKRSLNIAFESLWPTLNKEQFLKEDISVNHLKKGSKLRNGQKTRKNYILLPTDSLKIASDS